MGVYKRMMDDVREVQVDIDPTGAAMYIEELQNQIQQLESDIMRKDEEIERLRSDVLFSHLKMEEVRDFFRPLLIRIEDSAGDLKSKLYDIIEETEK